MFKLQAILADGTVAMECMIDGAEEAEELREQMLAFDRVTEVRILDAVGWSACSSRNSASATGVLML